MFVLDELSLLQAIDWSRVDVIIDRHPIISELVYFRYFGRKTKVPDLTTKNFDDFIQHPMILFYLDPSSKVLLSRGSERRVGSEIDYYGKEMAHFEAVLRDVGRADVKVCHVPFGTNLKLGVLGNHVLCQLKLFKER